MIIVFLSVLAYMYLLHKISALILVVHNLKFNHHSL